MLLVGVSYIAYTLSALGISFGAAADAVMAQAIAAMSPGLIAISMLERLIALVLHIGLSIMVFYGVRKNLAWFFAAVLLHAAADFPAGFYAFGKLSIAATELWAALIAAITLYIGFKLFRALKNEEAAAAQPLAG